jgi:putative oxidoreductase
MNRFNQNITWNVYLLLARLWLGYSMIKGGQSILRFFSSQELRDFFQNWFGNELGLPAPLLLAFIAKGTEFVGGILVCAGLFTRIAASLIAIVMLVATLVANLDYDGTEGLIRQDGLVTISCFLFASLFSLAGGGTYSIDHLIRRKKTPAITPSTASSAT